MRIAYFHMMRVICETARIYVLELRKFLTYEAARRRYIIRIACSVSPSERNST